MDEQERGLYLAYESSQARMERVNTKLWVVIILLIVALIGTNGAWIWYESQYEDLVVTQEVDATADGENDLHINTVGGDYDGGESTHKADG